MARFSKHMGSTRSKFPSYINICLGWFRSSGGGVKKFSTILANFSSRSILHIVLMIL